MSEEKGRVAMRLSKKGWNNVLIFGVLLIIFIVHFSQRLNLSPSQRSIIAKEFTIVEIETPDYTITRVGREWKSKPSMGVSSERLQQIVNNWQTVPLDTLTAQDIATSDFIIKFFVAEQQQPIIVQLHQQQDNDYILQIDEQQFLLLPTEKLTLFISK